MKKILSITIAICLVFFMCSCEMKDSDEGSPGEDNSDSPAAISVQIDEVEYQNGSTFNIDDTDIDTTKEIIITISNTGDNLLELADDTPVTFGSKRTGDNLTKSEVESCLSAYVSAFASCTIDNGTDLSGNPIIMKFKNNDSSVTWEYSYTLSEDTPPVPLSGNGSY